MKIYITTFHSANNYGAVLQSYALFTFLKKEYNVEIVNYHNKNIDGLYRVFRYKTNNLIHDILGLMKDLVNYRVNTKRANNFEKFRKMINVGTLVNNVEDLRSMLKDKDIIITGSDQVWNPVITGGIDNVYYLDFETNNKKISYAASCGDVNNITIYKEELKRILSSYKSISVREENLNKYIKEELNIKSKCVLDPTLLLDKEEWIKVVSKKRIIKNKYIFAYSVGNANENYYNTINIISEKTKLPVVFFDKYDLKRKIKCKKKSFYTAGPSEFLNLLYYSDYVVTTSFHALSFSIIFNKNVYITLSTYPDRLKTLVNLVGIDNRVIEGKNDLNNKLDSRINWAEINDKLNKAREKSAEWLLNEIESDTK